MTYVPNESISTDSAPASGTPTSGEKRRRLRETLDGLRLITVQEACQLFKQYLRISRSTFYREFRGELSFTSCGADERVKRIPERRVLEKILEALDQDEK